ncbi:MAG TPA: hypothetical protein EYP59_05115 [Thiotrichaceae bacterium]|nr:hypothetical protein [Thiotrichaceae bacterium]
MPTKLQAIDFGVKFVEGVFACRTESPLDSMAKERQKLLLTTYANVFHIENFDTDLQTIISYPPSYDFILKLAEILLSVEKRMAVVHNPKQCLDSYFFISSAITLLM